MDEETGLVKLGAGCSDEYYQSIGMVQLDVEQSEKDNQWYLTEKCPHYTEEEKEEMERQRIAQLFLTAADVERAIYKDKDIDFEDILAMLDNYPEIDKKAVRIEFKANNFYRGNPYVNQIGQLIGYTSEELDYLFEHGNFGEKTNEN